MDSDSRATERAGVIEASAVNLAPRGSECSAGFVTTNCRTPTAKTPAAYVQTSRLVTPTPRLVTPRSTAPTPYAKSLLPIRSPKVDLALREADTARFEARYHLKVAELRKANDAIKKLTAEAAIFKQSVAEKDEELESLRTKLKDSKRKADQLQREHSAVEDRLAALASAHAAALDSAAQKERLLLKEQQAVTNRRMEAQSLSLHTMTDIMKMTRRGLALAQTLRRVHSVDRGPPSDVSSLNENLLTRSAAVGVGGEAEVGMGPEGSEAEVGMGSEGSGVSDDVPDVFGSELEEEPSLMSIAASSAVLESATVHDSPLFLTDVADSKGTSISTGQSMEESEGINLELPLPGESSFEDDGDIEASGGITEGGHVCNNHETEAKVAERRKVELVNGMREESEGLSGALNDKQEDGQDGKKERRATSTGAGSASATILRWSPPAGALSTPVLTSARRCGDNGAPGKSEQERSVRPSSRSALASIQNLESSSPSRLVSPRRGKYGPSSDIENNPTEAQLTQSAKEKASFGGRLSSGLSKQFSPKPPSLNAMSTGEKALQPVSPLFPGSLTLLGAKCQLNTGTLSGRSPIVARFAERHSPLPRACRPSHAFAKPVDSPSRFQDPKPAPYAPPAQPTPSQRTSPPTARRLLIDTPPKQVHESTKLYPLTTDSPGLQAADSAGASPFLGWPMPALAETSPLTEPVAPAKLSFPEAGTAKTVPEAPKPPGSSTSAFGAQTSQLLVAVEPVTPKGLLARADSLGGSPYFADLTTPVQSSPPSNPSLIATGSTGGAQANKSGFGWGLQDYPGGLPKLPVLAIPPQPLLSSSGPPSRKRTNLGTGFHDGPGNAFADGLKGALGLAAAQEDVEGPSKGLSESPETVQGFDAPGGHVAEGTGGHASGLGDGEWGAERSMAGAKSTEQGLVRQEIVVFEQGTVTSGAGGPVRRSRRQGRLSKELGMTRGGTGEKPAAEASGEGSSAERKHPARNVTLKDITSHRRGSVRTISSSNPQTPEIIEFAPVSPPSATSQTAPPASESPEPLPPGPGVCSVLVILEESKRGAVKAAQKTPNVIGCVEVPKTTTLAALRKMIQQELGARGPARFAFLQAGIGATWHAFSGEIEGHVTALTLPPAEGPYQQLAGETVMTSTPADPPVPSPTRHAVRLAILRPLPVKRTLYSATGSSGMGLNGPDVSVRRGGLRTSAENDEAPFGPGTRLRPQSEAPKFPAPWATRPAPTLASVSSAGLSVRVTGGLREMALADAARRESRLRARDK